MGAALQTMLMRVVYTNCNRMDKQFTIVTERMIIDYYAFNFFMAVMIANLLSLFHGPQR
jgi:hypothetical protein